MHPFFSLMEGYALLIHNVSTSRIIYSFISEWKKNEQTVKYTKEVELSKTQKRFG